MAPATGPAALASPSAPSLIDDPIRYYMAYGKLSETELAPSMHGCRYNGGMGGVLQARPIMETTSRTVTAVEERLSRLESWMQSDQLPRVMDTRSNSSLLRQDPQGGALVSQSREQTRDDSSDELQQPEQPHRRVSFADSARDSESDSSSPAALTELPLPTSQSLRGSPSSAMHLHRRAFAFHRPSILHLENRGLVSKSTFLLPRSISTPGGGHGSEGEGLKRENSVRANQPLLRLNSANLLPDASFSARETVPDPFRLVSATNLPPSPAGSFRVVM